MQGVLILEPECRTKTLLKFLEIHRHSRREQYANSGKSSGVQSGGNTPGEQNHGLGPGHLDDEPHMMGGGNMGIDDDMPPGMGGVNPGMGGANNVGAQYYSMQAILERAHGLMIDLAQSPSSLDPQEVEYRTAKFEDMMYFRTWYICSKAKPRCKPKFGFHVETRGQKNSKIDILSW